METIKLNTNIISNHHPFFETVCRDPKDEQIKALKAEIEKSKKKAELPEKYIINENATILFWKDGTKTVVRKCEDDEFNPRLGFLTAFFQHYCGMSKNKANKYLAQLNQEMPKEKETRKNFKLGDRVKALTTDLYVKKGWTGTIERIEGNNIRVCWDNGETWWQLKNELKLIMEGAK